MDLMEATAKQMPLTRERALFTRGDRAVVSILGRNVIDRAVNTAEAGTKLCSYKQDQINDDIMQHLDKLPTTKEEKTTNSRRNCFKVSRTEMRMLITRLDASPILTEQFVAIVALRRMGNIPVDIEIPTHHEIELVRFGTACPPRLEKELIAITNKHLPPGTPMTFGPVTAEPLETESLYYNPDILSNGTAAP